MPACPQTFVPNWTLKFPAASPSAREQFAMAYDAIHGRVVLFGGFTGSSYLGDTWVWNGTTWALQTPAASPTARYGASMAYDAARGKVVLFGGDGPSGYLNDTWVWDGTNWTEESPGSSPPVRYAATMAYDAAHGQVVLFGGYSSISGALGDTWAWNGTNWAQETPATSPSARYAAAMAFDAPHGQTVLFGGFSGSAYFGDTWVWNGTNWTAESPAASPSARIGPAAAYDVALGHVVLFGGYEGDDLGDTWVWDGTNWTQESPAASPTGRRNSSMAYDAARGHVVLFGGFRGSSSLADTWEYGQSDFGSVSIGTTGTAQNLNFSIPGGTTVGSIGVLTQGAPNLDFTDVGDGTCTATTYTSATNCTVDVQFAPRFAGLRMGAVVFKDGSGNLLSTTYVHGIGTGPQIAFEPATITTVGGGFGGPAGVAVDGSGSVYVADTGNNAVKEMPAGCTSSSCVTTVGGGFSIPRGAAVDGSGNVYVADTFNSAIKEMPPDCASASCVTALGSGFNYPFGVAVDGSGHVYIADNDNKAVKEMPPGCASASCVTTLGGGFATPTGVAVDGSGNVYVADNENNAVKEMPPGCASPSCVTTLGGGFESPSSVAVDGSGNIYVTDFVNNAVKEMSPGCASSSCVTTLSAGFSRPYGLALDGAGNVYVADSGHDAVEELNAAAPPTLTFPTATAVGSTDTTDGTLTAQVFNIGNMPLVFSALTYPTDFSEASDTNPCTSSTTLTAGQECDVPVQFAPQNPGSPLNEDVTLTNNSLNGTDVQQSILLSGTAEPPAAAPMVSPSPGSILTSASTTFTWSAVPAGATAYYLWIGSTPGGYDLANMGPFTGTNATVTLPTNGTMIYVRLWTFFNGGATQLYNDYTYTEFAPSAAAITSPSNGSTLTSASTTFNWNAGTGGVTAYYLWIGTTAGGYDLANTGPFTGTSATVTLPTNGTTIYVRLWTLINGGATQLHNDYTYIEATPAGGAITSPSPGSTLLSASTTFNWNAGTGGVTAYYLWVGTTAGGYDLANTGPFTGTSATVTLPTSGAPIYVRLWTLINGGAIQLHNDYTYIEATPAAGAITSPSPGSTLLSASTTFNWNAGTGGATSYYLWIGTTPGGYDLANMGPISGTSATVTLPTNGNPIYVRLWTFIDGGATQLSNDYIYTEASVLPAQSPVRPTAARWRRVRPPSTGVRAPVARSSTISGWVHRPAPPIWSTWVRFPVPAPP